MPQMSPYNWLSLNILFTFIFLTYIILTHFSPLSIKSPKFDPTGPPSSAKKFPIKW